MRKGKILSPDVEYFNEIALNGEVSRPVNVGGSKMATFYIKTKRFSPVEDELHIYTPAENIKGLKLQKGCFVRVRGEIRTRNITVGEGRRLQVSVLAKQLKNIDESFTRTEEYIKEANRVILKGTICKKKPFKETPNGHKVQEDMIAVNNYDEGESYYIAMIGFDKCAEIMKKYYFLGDKVQIKATLQSREYEKDSDGKTEKRLAHELVVHQIQSANREK